MRFNVVFGFTTVFLAASAALLAGCGDSGSTGTTSGSSSTTTTTTTTGAGGSTTTTGAGGAGGSSTTTTTTTGAGGAGGSSTTTTTTTGAGGAGGAGPMAFLDLSFDNPAVTYTLTGFGEEIGTVVADPTNAANKVAQVDKPVNAALWAGTTISTLPNNQIVTLPFSASATKMSVRVWSPDANIPVRIKVEDAADPTHSCETEAMVTAASTWQTLEFDFANQAPGTAALNTSYVFNRVSLFINFGTDGATAGAKTYYFDNVVFP